MSFIIIYCYYFSLIIFRFVLLLYFVFFSFFRSPSLVPLSCSFRPENNVVTEITSNNFFSVTQNFH